MTVSPTTLGHYIKFQRESHSLTQKELAEKADVSPATISGTENERFIPSPEILHRLARVLHIPFHELVERLPPQKTDVLLEIVQIYRLVFEYDRALELISTLNTKCKLLDYQQDALMLEEGSILIMKQETSLKGVEMLNSLAKKVEATPPPDHLFVVKVQNAIGNAWWYKNRDFYTAKYHYQRAIDLLQSHPMVEDKIVPALYYNIANCLLAFRQEEAAIDYLKQAIPLYNNYQLPNHLAGCYYILGICYQQLGNLQESSLNFRTAIPYFEEAGNKRFAVNSRSYSYFYGTEPPEVKIAVMEEDLELLQDEFDDSIKAVTLSRIALLYLDLHDLPRAKAVLKQSERLLAPSGNNEQRAFFLLTSAKYMMAAGEYEAASTYAIEASDLYASLRVINTYLQEALYTARIALQRLRESFGQKKSS